MTLAFFRRTDSGSVYCNGMEKGDIVTQDGNWYLVCQVSEQGDAFLLDKDANSTVTREDDAFFHVECNPYRAWPFVVLPHKFYRMGALKSVGLPNLDGKETKLTLYKDWLLGDPGRNGGTVYLSPALKLRPVDRLVLTYTKGQTSVIIPKNFRPVSVRAAAARFQRSGAALQKTAYDHLLGNDDED